MVHPYPTTSSLCSLAAEIGPPKSCRSRPTATGRDLPDADGPGFVALSGRFRAENRSLIGRGCVKTLGTFAN
jgi:hypothetical protein